MHESSNGRNEALRVHPRLAVAIVGAYDSYSTLCRGGDSVSYLVGVAWRRDVPRSLQIAEGETLKGLMTASASDCSPVWSAWPSGVDPATTVMNLQGPSSGRYM